MKVWFFTKSINNQARPARLLTKFFKIKKEAISARWCRPAFGTLLSCHKMREKSIKEEGKMREEGGRYSYVCGVTIHTRKTDEGDDKKKKGRKRLGLLSSPRKKRFICAGSADRVRSMYTHTFVHVCLCSKHTDTYTRLLSLYTAVFTISKNKRWPISRLRCSSYTRCIEKRVQQRTAPRIRSILSSSTG